MCSSDKPVVITLAMLGCHVPGPWDGEFWTAPGTEPVLRLTDEDASFLRSCGIDPL